MLTDGVHEAAVHVGVEQVGHGQHSAVAQRRQASRHAPLTAGYLLSVVLRLAAVIQQVHKECEVPDGGKIICWDKSSCDNYTVHTPYSIDLSKKVIRLTC